MTKNHKEINIMISNHLSSMLAAENLSASTNHVEMIKICEILVC